MCAHTSKWWGWEEKYIELNIYLSLYPPEHLARSTLEGLGDFEWGLSKGIMFFLLCLHFASIGLLPTKSCSFSTTFWNPFPLLSFPLLLH